MAIAQRTRYEASDFTPPASLYSQPANEPPQTTAPGRLVSLDAYRGLIMILMISAGLQIGRVVKNFDSIPLGNQLHTPLWDKLAFQTEHTAWTGCSLWDVIQPSFMFMVGTAMAFSLASRRSKGQSFFRMLLHALFRAAALVLLAVFLSSPDHHRTNWIFTNVLAQIGLGYPLLFLVAWLRPRWQFTAAMVILLGTWIAFAASPKSDVKFHLASVDVRTQWNQVEGFATPWTQAHWQKNENIAARFDRWFLNLFPAPDGKPFTENAGGYQTLNFVPSLATMIFGLLAGELLRGRFSGAKKVGILLGTGALALAAGWALGRLGICPVSKRIWSPSWAIFSAGWALLAMGFFFLLLDVWRVRGWEYPLIVVGANSIAIYCVSQLLKPWVRGSMKRHFGQEVYEFPGRTWAWLHQRFTHSPASTDTVAAYGKIFAPMAEAAFFLFFCWILCWWAYRRKLFIKL